MQFFSRRRIPFFVIILILFLLAGSVIIFFKTKQKAYNFSQDNVSEPARSYTLVSVEKIVTQDLGSSAKPYKYWDKTKSIYHKNSITADPQEDYTCTPQLNFFTNIEMELNNIINNGLRSENASNIQVKGTGFLLTAENGKQIFLLETTDGKKAFCFWKKDCPFEDELPFVDQRSVQANTIYYSDNDKLFNILNNLDTKNYAEYSQCSNLETQRSTSTTPVYKP